MSQRPRADNRNTTLEKAASNLPERGTCLGLSSLRAGDAFKAKLTSKWQGHAKVLKQMNNVNYRVEKLIGPKQVETYHV